MDGWNRRGRTGKKRAGGGSSWAAARWRLSGWGWAIVVGAVGLGVAFLSVLTVTHGSSGSEPSIAGIACDRNEQLNYHVHAHLSIFVDGNAVEVPAGIGITDSCFYWLHTHDSSGLIHIEAPSQQVFTVGQFFQVWGEPVSATSLLSQTVDAGHQIRAYVNGEEFSGNPADIALGSRTDIVLEYGPPFPAPSPYQFPAGL